jgi:hypothetical protein
MSLSWNVEKIDNYETVCWIKKEDGEGSRLNPVTEALIFNSMAIDIGLITNDNAAEVFARTRILESVNGEMLIKSGKGTMITIEDIRAHVGLSTNVSFKSRKEWAMRWFVGHGDYLRHYGQKRKSEQEIQFAEDNMDGIDVSRTEDYARQYRKEARKHSTEGAVEGPPR